MSPPESDCLPLHNQVNNPLYLIQEIIIRLKILSIAKALLFS